jgi:hypothetical protein
VLGPASPPRAIAVLCQALTDTLQRRGESSPGVIRTTRPGYNFEEALPAIRLHDLRHTYATVGLRAATGWHEVKVISKRLGHASIGFTLDTYAHVLSAADEQTAHTLARHILAKQHDDNDAHCLGCISGCTPARPHGGPHMERSVSAGQRGRARGGIRTPTPCGTRT